MAHQLPALALSLKRYCDIRPSKNSAEHIAALRQHTDLPIIGIEKKFSPAGLRITPDFAFALGAGGGVEYKLKPRILLRISGDEIISSSTEDPNHLGYSSHEHKNPHATIGVVYKF